MYRNSNDIVTPHMDINSREVGSLSVNVSPVGELCTAEYRLENGQKILIVAIYILVNKKLLTLSISYTNNY